MTPVQQRIAIAEVCGWIKVKQYSLGPAGQAPWQTDNFYLEQGPICLPDYLNDLNAIHDAEKLLIYKDDPESDLILDYLCYLTRCADLGNSSFATATQRSKALLKTLNLWKD